jgi:hypothetical protein
LDGVLEIKKNAYGFHSIRVFLFWYLHARRDFCGYF